MQKSDEPMEAASGDVLALVADNTHLYPGARLTADKSLPTLPVEAIVLFRDDARAEAVLTPSADEFVLTVEPYVTAAGASIGRKPWSLRIADDGLLRVGRLVDG